MSNTLKFGNGQWATKEGSTLAYNDENGNFKPLPFNFERNSSATRVNKNGLIEVVGSDEPRVDYLNNADGHLLLEPSRTNSFSYSEPIANEGAALDISYEPFIWTLGFTNCIKFGDNSVDRFRYGGSVLASTQYTVSAFVIMDDLSEPLVSNSSSVGDFSFVVGGGTGGVVNSNVHYGNNIYRVSVTLTSGSNLSNNGVIKYTTQSSKGFRITGFQLEQGSYATSYIPTQGSAATRVAETCNGAGDANTFNDSEGVLFAEISASSNLGYFRLISLAKDGNNTVFIGFHSNYNKIIGAVYVGGALQANMIYTIADETEFHKVAIKYALNDFALWVDGIEAVTDNSGSVFPASTLDEIRFDDGGAGSNVFYGNVKQIQYFDSALTDVELQQLTS